MNTDNIIEEVSEKVHNNWVKSKQEAGVVSRKLDTTGEELMISYSLLSEEAKDLDRGTVKTVIKALQELGYL